MSKLTLLFESRLSFIPNTSELAFLGLAKQAQDHLDCCSAAFNSCDTQKSTLRSAMFGLFFSEPEIRGRLSCAKVRRQLFSKR